MQQFWILDNYYTLDMKPSREELLPYVHDKRGAAEVFGVSEKTILRWLKSHNIYEHGQYGRGKLNLKKAREIRQRHKEGVSIKSLAEEYQVTFAAISRVVPHITYKEHSINDALINVIYNP